MTKTRKLIGNMLIFLTVSFIIYLSAVMMHRINTVVLSDAYRLLYRYELLGCAGFLLFSLDVRFGFFTKLRPVLLKAGGWVLRIAAVLLTAVQLFFFARITAGCFARTDTGASHAIVLGMALENGQPTEELLSRLNTAELFLLRNPDATLILTGGNADASGRTEADVMHEILASRGVAEDRMILEDRAENTIANFRNSAELIGSGEPVVLISSDYHMDRAVHTAYAAGFSEVLRDPAPSSLLYFASDVMGEIMLEINELTLGI